MAYQMSKMKPKQSIRQSKTSKLCFRIFITTILVLTAIISSVKTATCSSSVPSSAATTTEQCSFDGYSITYTYGVVGGPVSKSLYYLYCLSSSSESVAVRKVDASGSQTWMASFPFYPILKSLSVDAAEQSVYLASWTSILMVLKLSSSDGSVVSQHQFTGISGDNEDIKTWPLTDLSGYFVIGVDSSTPNYAKICKYTFSSSSAQCQTITNIYVGYGHLMVSNSQFFVIGVPSASPYSLQIYKITFLSTSVDWANQITCTSGTCSTYLSESLLSSDQSTIYSFFLFGSIQYLYFAGLSVTGGSVVTTRYKSSTSVSVVYGSALNGDYVVATTQSPTSLIMYSISSLTFTIKSFSDNNLYGCGVEPSSGRFVTGGFIGGNGYITKFVPQSISLNSDLSSASWSMTALSSGTDDINPQSGVTIAAPDVSFTLASAEIYTNQTVTYNSFMNTTSDVYFQVNTQTYSVCESTTSTQTPNLPCSFSGSTSITYSLSSYNGSIVPSFVSINSATGVLTITAPCVSSSTDYSFNILSKVSGITDPTQNIIKLSVNNCTVGSCSSSEVAKLLSAIIQGVIAATALLSLGLSLSNLSSMAILWSAINQVQILFLLFLTGAFIPKDIEVIITGLMIYFNPFSYLQLKINGNYNFVSNFFDFGLKNSNLEKLGIQSDSTIVNITSLIFSLIIICFIHLCIALTQKLLSKESKSNCCTYVLSGIHWILQKLMIFLTFALYIRIILQTNQFTLISCVSEISFFNISGTKRMISTIFALFVLIVCIAIVIFTILLSFSEDAYKISESPDKRRKCDHLFDGVTLNKKSRLFVCLLLIRRAVFVILLITIEPKSSIVVISLLVGLQLIYFVFLVAIRPYREINCNAIEITNELYFLVILASLLKYNTAADWEGTPTSEYTWLIASNFFVGFLINLVDGVLKIVIKCKNKCLKKNAELIQENNAQPVDASRIENSANDADPSNVQVNKCSSAINGQFVSKTTRHRVGNRVYVKR